ncbi:MAG: lipoprotein-releasing ABC transporter permease subunit [candidate division Zixibacteria bacterium]|nr:lipoprotein-releasing ABC transporter permease subunit [candidate division Zixibacteria bacterium]
MSYASFIARRYLRSKQRHGFLSLITLISILGVVVGAAVLVFALAIMKGFELEVKSRIVGTTAHISIFHRFADGILHWTDVESQIAHFPEVQAVAPFIYYKAAISSAEANDGVIVRGIIPNQEAAVTRLKETVTDGDWTLTYDSTKSRPILLGSTLADRLQVKVGDEVVLYSLRGEALSEGQPPRIMKFAITGLFETGMYEYDASLCYIRLADAQHLFLLPDRVSGFQVRIADWNRADKVAALLEDSLASDLYATDWMRMHRNLFGWMEIEKRWAIVALSLIVAVAAFNIVSTLIMVVIDKRREIAVLKTLGVPSGGVRAIFLWQGTTIGVVGTVAGLSLGLLMCWVQKTFNLVSLPPEIYFISTLPVIVDAGDVATVGVLAIMISFLATIYPASRAAMLYPVDVLRYE